MSLSAFVVVSLSLAHIKSCHSACLPQGKSNISDAVAMHPDIDASSHGCAFVTDNAVMVHARDIDQGNVSVTTGLLQSVKVKNLEN